MAEKIVSDLSDVTLEDDEMVSGSFFLQAVSDKVRQLDKVSIVEYKTDRRLLFFSIETPRINDIAFANELIKLIDELTFLYFFKKPKNLSQENWCAKYMLFSSFIVSRKVQSIQFTWFKNLFRHKICPCFICDTYYKEAQKNDKQ